VQWYFYFVSTWGFPVKKKEKKRLCTHSDFFFLLLPSLSLRYMYSGNMFQGK
jgi:hypothetical protein